MVPEIAEHARFFDHLVELVPAKFYYDEDFSRMNPRHLAKAAREALKADVKFKAKVARLDKFNPDKPATTLDLQRRKKQEAQQAKEPNGTATAAAAGGDGAGPSTSGRPAVKVGSTVRDAAAAGTGLGAGSAAASGLQLQLSNGALSRQELLERLHRKVEEARQRRKASDETATKAKEWKQNALQGSAEAAKMKQRQQQAGSKGGKGQQPANGKRKGGPAEGGDGGEHGRLQQGQTQGQQAKKARREGQQQGGAQADGEEVDFKFARIEVEDGRHGKGPHGAKKPPKQVLLKQAEAQKAELEALVGTEEGKAKAQQAAWKAALARASGEKVLDDPKLLRRTLKRESKRKEKHAKAWKERVSTQQETQTARQAKRNDNLAARRQTKLENKKAKREKKLLRPGFEGRKEGFITPGKAAGAPAGGAASK